MIYKYIKCESVIAKIMADADMEDKEMRVTDIKEWIFEAVEKIGAPMQYIQKESGVDGVPIFEIHDRQIPIPADLVHLTAVAYSHSDRGEWTPVRKDDSDFKQSIPGRRDFHDRHDHHDHHAEYFHHSNQFDQTYLNYDGSHHIMERPRTTQGQMYTVNGMRYLHRMLGDKDHLEPTFFVKPGWIVLNKRHGFVKLSYKAIASDERGYPLIPDLESYKEAIYWYVMMKLTFPKWLKGNFATKRAAKGAEYAYTYIQQQWNFYRNQAYAEAMMPTESDMITIKNEWTKLVPEWDSDDIFFKSEGKRQLNYTDYYYGY